MKKLSKFIHTWLGLEQIEVSIFGVLPGEAADDFNGMVEALAHSDPYHHYPAGLSSVCIHCKTKYDPTADPLDIMAHHSESCIWRCCRNLVELCKKAKAES